MSILVVEPFDEIRTLVEEALRRAGHEVRNVGDGSAAVEALQCETFDCVVVGSPVVLDEGGGPRLLLARMHELYAGSTPPCVVVLTTHVESIAVLALAARLGACAVVAKPFTPQALVDVLGRCLQGGHGSTLWLGIPTRAAAEAAAAASLMRLEDDLVR